MSLALDEAQKAKSKGEVPVGCVVVSQDHKILAKSHNIKEVNFNPCGHAEILSLIEAGQKIKNWRLLNCSLFVTLEPCPMCLSAMVNARIKHLYFGAYDPKGGSISLNYPFYKDSRLNHNFKVTGGLHHFECSKLISDFFRARRKVHKLA